MEIDRYLMSTQCVCVSVHVHLCCRERGGIKFDVTLTLLSYGDRLLRMPQHENLPAEILHHGCLILPSSQQGPSLPLDKRQPLLATYHLDGHLAILPER